MRCRVPNCCTFVSEPAVSKESGRRGRAVRPAAWSDERLVRECLKGNEEAWFGLIEKYKNLIYSIPVKYGTPPDGANEIFQQVCFELVTELPRLRESKSLAAWLIAVTSHKSFDWSKREERYQPIDNARESNVPTLSEPPDTLIFELEREQILREVFAHIAPRCRALIRMLFFDRQPASYKEAARSLGLAEGSIGFIRMRCLRQLRRLLEQKGFQ
jgi:RNA polymerase sigma factor (sigma-70 family)